MIRNYFFINLILLIIIGLLGVRFYKVLVRPLGTQTQVLQQQDQADKKGGAGKKLIDKKELSVDEEAYHIIVQKDLFRPSRSAPYIGDATKGVVSSRDTPKLFGTIINNEKSAILEDPSTKITRLYRINDSIAGFVITDIQKDKVILLKEGRPVEVNLREIKTVTLPPQKPQRPASRSSRRPRRILKRPPSPPSPKQQTPEITPPSPSGVESSK